MVAAYERATVACSILGQPVVNGITGTVGAPSVVLSDRLVTPLQPLEEAGQVVPLDSYRLIRQGFMFAADDDDWTALLTVDEGMVLHLTAADEDWIIRRADAWEPSVADGIRKQRHLLLTVEKVKVTA